MWLESLDPTTGRIPEPRTPKRGQYGGVSLAVFSRNRKHRAIGRVEHLPLWQGLRTLITVLINHGSGPECSSWLSDEALAERCTFSGGRKYSVDHLRVCRRMGEDFGLLRSRRVLPHHRGPCNAHCKGTIGHFPSRGAPEADGGGMRTNCGGKVMDVNLAAILGEASPWKGPLREMGWQDARERREGARPDVEPPAAARGAPVLVALEGGRGSVAEAPDDELEAVLEAPAAASPAPSGEPVGVSPPVGMSDQGGVIMDAHTCDLGSPSENLSIGSRVGYEQRPETARPPGDETHATAGMETHDAELEAARAAPPVASPSGPRRPSPVATQSEATTPAAIAPREQRTKGEQTPSQTLAVDPGAIAPKDLAELRKLFPDAAWSWASPRVVPLRGGGGGSSSGQAPPAAPPSRGPRLFDDEGPMGRNGERPPGWRGPGGGGRGT
jgi:hypothetical protein